MENYLDARKILLGQESDVKYYRGSVDPFEITPCAGDPAALTRYPWIGFS